MRSLRHGAKLPLYSDKVNLQINGIYEKLVKTFTNLTPTTDEIDRTSTADEVDRALEAMELIAPLSERDAAQKSYNLFRVVMKAPISATYTQQKKWEAARLTMHGAYKSDEFLPPVKDPQDILDFLTHHFDLTAKDSQYQDAPIQNALRALGHASSPAAVKSLKGFDPTQPRFFADGIRYAYRNDKQPQLRKAAFFFLPLISDKWFDTPHQIMKPDEMKSFCADWASTMDSIEDTDDVKRAGLTVLFGMINSPHWRPHIVEEKWKLLESFALVTDDSQALRKCIGNLELIDTIKGMGNAENMTRWLKILWLRYGELIKPVKDRLEATTKEFAQSRRRTDVDECMLALKEESKKADWALSHDPNATALKERVGKLQQAHTHLAALARG